MANQNKQDIAKAIKEVQKRYQQELHLYHKQIEKIRKHAGKKIA